MYKLFLFASVFSILAISPVSGMYAGEANANQNSEEIAFFTQATHHSSAKGRIKKDSPKYSKQKIGNKFTFIQKSFISNNINPISASVTALTTRNHLAEQQQFNCSILSHSALLRPIPLSAKNEAQEEDCLCVAIQSNQAVAVKYLLSIDVRTSVKVSEQLQHCTNSEIFDLMVQACVKERGSLFKL